MIDKENGAVKQMKIILLEDTTRSIPFSNVLSNAKRQLSDVYIRRLEEQRRFDSTSVSYYKFEI